MIYNNMNCPCCGGKMKANHGDKLTVFKCNSCGLTNTELKHNIK
jgi:ribosomal protein S27AE